jgi:hypothetical protein
VGDGLGGAVKEDLVLGAVRDRDVAGRIVFGPVAVMIDLESWRRILAGKGDRDGVFGGARGLGHGRGSPAIGRAAKIPGIGGRCTAAARHHQESDLLGGGVERDPIAGIVADGIVLCGMCISTYLLKATYEAGRVRPMGGSCERAGKNQFGDQGAGSL